MVLTSSGEGAPQRAAQFATRRAAPDHVGWDIAPAGGPRNPSPARRDDGRDLGAVEAFLDDHERVERVRTEARTEAERRAEEWGLDGQLSDD